MLQEMYKGKLERAKSILVPALFTEIQYRVLLKQLQRQKLTQTEKNYLSKAIKAKLIAAAQIKHINIFRQQRRKKGIQAAIVASYLKSGIGLFGYHRKTRAMPPVAAVKAVLENIDQLDARIADLLPVYIFKNQDKINLFEIYSYAVENSLTNLTGYLFEIVQKHQFSRELKEFLSCLEKQKENMPVLRDQRYLQIAGSIKQDFLSRKWNIITLNTLEDYKRYFAEYT